MATTAPVVALHYADGALRALDQTRLPWREVELTLTCADEVIAAIRRLSIRLRRGRADIAGFSPREV